MKKCDVIFGFKELLGAFTLWFCTVCRQESLCNTSCMFGMQNKKSHCNVTKCTSKAEQFTLIVLLYRS